MPGPRAAGIDHRRGARLVVGTAGRDTAAAEPGNGVGETFANCSGRAAGAGTKTQTAGAAATAAADYAAGVYWRAEPGGVSRVHCGTIAHRGGDARHFCRGCDGRRLFLLARNSAGSEFAL